MKDAALMAVAQFTSFVVITMNFRAIASGRYLEAGATAAAASVIGYIVTKKIAKAENHHGLIGLVIGGALADMTGIWLTKGWH